MNPSSTSPYTLSASQPQPPTAVLPSRRTSRTPSELSAATTATNPVHNHAFMLASSTRSTRSAATASHRGTSGQVLPSSSEDADVRLLCEELDDMDLESQAHFAASQTPSHGRASSAAGLRDSHLRFRASAMDPFPFDGGDLWLAAGAAKNTATPAPAPTTTAHDSHPFDQQQHGEFVDPIVNDLDFVLGNTDYRTCPIQPPLPMTEYEEQQPANKKLSIIEEVTEATTSHSHSHSHSHTATHFRQTVLQRIASPSNSMSPNSASPTSPAIPTQAPSSPTLTFPGGIRRGQQMDPQPHSSPGSIHSSTLTVRGNAPANTHGGTHTPRAAPGSVITGVEGTGDQHLDTSYHQLLQPDYSTSERVSSLGLVGLSSNPGYTNDHELVPSDQQAPPPNHIILDETLSEVNNNNDDTGTGGTSSGMSSLDAAPNSPLARKSTPASAIGSMRSRHGSASLRATPLSSSATPASTRPRTASESPATAFKQSLTSPLDHRASVRRLSSAQTIATMGPTSATRAGDGNAPESSSSALNSLAAWRMQVAAAASAADHPATRQQAPWEMTQPEERNECVEATVPHYDMSAESTPPQQFLPNADVIDNDNHLNDDQDNDPAAYIHGVTTADFDLGESPDNQGAHDHELDRRSVLSSDSSIASISLRYENYSNQALDYLDSWRPSQAVPGTMGLPFVTPPGSSGMPSPSARGNSVSMQGNGAGGDYPMATPDTSPPINNTAQPPQQQIDGRRPSTPPRAEGDTAALEALTMTAVRRQLHNRLSAVEDTPMAFQDALTSLENIVVSAPDPQTPKRSKSELARAEEVTPRPRSAAAVQLKLLEMASAASSHATSSKHASPPSPSLSRGASLPVRPASASGTIRPPAQVGFAGQSTTPREVGVPFDVGSSSMDEEGTQDRISLRIGSSSSSPIGHDPGRREFVLPEPSFAKSSRPASPTTKPFSWAPIPYVMPPDTPAPPRVAAANASDGDHRVDNNQQGRSRSPSPPAVAMHPALTQTLLALAPNRSLASLVSLSSLDLSSRSLPSLERLDSVAPHLVTLHAGHNALQFVQGVPDTVRTLVVPMNRLAPLSSFHHLATSLHTLDISGNLMDDLFPLKCLVNLQSLNADKNGVRKWDKVPSMPALRWLSLRGNHIPEIDGTVVDLPVLHHLNLADNCVSSVVGLGEGLPALQVLHLDNNAIMGPMPGGHPGVIELSVLDNMIDMFDARMWPAVKRVELGGNAVQRIELETMDQVEYIGLAGQTHMDPRAVRAGGRARVASGTVSAGTSAWRDQKPSSGADDGMDEETLRLLAPDDHDGAETRRSALHYADLQPASRLNLSGNALPSLEQFVHMYQLVHLNLAGCGLRSLPARFARHVPALRALDLAQNCLQDISPLCKLSRLRWLSLRGNDLADFFHTVGYLAHLTRLEWLDLRQNPLTGLFYPNLVAGSSFKASASGAPSRQEVATDDAEWARIDAEYQQSLNDSTVVKRACYRTSLLFHLRASLQVLDRLHISEQERIGVPAKYSRMEKSLAGIMAGSAGSMRAAATVSTKSTATSTPASRIIGLGHGEHTIAMSHTPSRTVSRPPHFQQLAPQPPRALTPIGRRTAASPRMPQHGVAPSTHASMLQHYHPLPSVPSLGSQYAASDLADGGSEHGKGDPGSPTPAIVEGELGGDKSPSAPSPQSGGASTQASWVQLYGDLTSETEILREIHHLTASERGRRPPSPLQFGLQPEHAPSSVASPASTVIRPPVLQD